MKLNLNKIPVLGKQWWGGLSGFISKWVYQDATVGLFQGKFDIQKQMYRSEQYVKYKANEMRYFGRGKEKKGKGEKIRNKYVDYKSVSTNTQTQFVNMMLTERTINSLAMEDSDDTGVTMAYKPEHTGKILGGKKWGRNLVGLNDKNVRLVKVQMIKEYKDKLGKVPKNIEIHIGK